MATGTSIFRLRLGVDIEVSLLAKILVDKRLCKGCGICVEFCPRKALEMSNEMDERGIKTPQAPREKDCSLCGLCELYCPDFAICARRRE